MPSDFGSMVSWLFAGPPLWSSSVVENPPPPRRATVTTVWPATGDCASSVALSARPSPFGDTRCGSGIEIWAPLYDAMRPSAMGRSLVHGTI